MQEGIHASRALKGEVFLLFGDKRQVTTADVALEDAVSSIGE